jgi:hypothetical protein
MIGAITKIDGLPNLDDAMRAATNPNLLDRRFYGDEGMGQPDLAQGLEIPIPQGDKVRSELDSLQQANADAAEKTKEAWAQAGGEISGALIKAAADGKESVGAMVEDIAKKLAMVAAQQAAMKMGGSSGAFVSALASALGGGRDGFDYVANANRLQLPGFATGGDGLVTGGGSQDSQLLMARISAGESFHVRTSQQRMAEAAEWDAMRQAARSARGPGSTRVNLIVSGDPREVTAAMGTYAGERVVARMNRKFAKHRTG